MDNSPKLGELPLANSRRDAVHIAVYAVKAAEDLLPGARVRVSLYSRNEPNAWLAYDEQEDGVVDPFLLQPVKEGEWFWLMLFPGSIVGLRHDWTHPVFPSETATSIENAESSEKWLRAYALRYRTAYDSMVNGAKRGEWVGFGDDNGPPQYRGAEVEFWHHMEVLTGQKFGKAHRDKTSFNCAC